MIGQELGHYRVVEKLGEGGMGVVYRAHDARLNREVAIKLLAPEVAKDPERLARLRREAHVLASLNHSNIAGIHGLEEQGGHTFLVLELVEGDTLAERIARGALPKREAIRIAEQIAEAMEEAHHKGIVHRDLKPANVKVKPDGAVKVLDFGLAKAISGDQPGADLSREPTASAARTREGAVVGTAAYMSPEQARGGAVDKSADIWAFGCVLYEMLTGLRAFRGATAADVTAAVLRGELDWSSLLPDTPPSLRSLLKACLEDEPKSRLRDIGDARLFLDSAAAEGSAAGLAAARPSRLRPSWLSPLAVVGLAAVSVLVGFVLTRFMTHRESPSPMYLPMAPPSGLKPSLGFGPSVAISPDGGKVAYVLESATTTLLYVKGLEDLEARPLPGTTGARTPFFSPAGQWIGFFDEDDRKLKKVSLGGGEPVAITEADVTWGAAWAADDTILFTSNHGLVRVPAAGGTPVRVTNAKAGEHAWPELLPGGRGVLFTILAAGGTYDEASIAVLPPAGGRPKIVFKSAYFPHYAPTGHLIFVQGNSVLAAPFDLGALEVTGPPVTVLQGVWISSWTGYADFAFSNTGNLVYVSGGPVAEATLVSVDRAGNASPLLGEPRAYRTPRLSADGRQLAVTLVDQQIDIWIYDFSRKTLNRLTDSPSWDAYPQWQPGTEWIAFSSMREGLAKIYRKNLSSGAVEMLVKTDRPSYPSSWSPDGKLLLYEEEDPKTGHDIWIYSVEARSRWVFLSTPYAESNPEFSPDGRLIAYESDEAGEQVEVYLRPYPEVNPRRRISTDGGISPRWGPEGKELFYRVGGKLMAVDIETKPDLVVGAPRELFEGPYGNSYDVAHNGQSFVMATNMAEGQPPTRINFVVNWFEELKRLAK